MYRVARSHNKILKSKGVLGQKALIYPITGKGATSGEPAGQDPFDSTQFGPLTTPRLPQPSQIAPQHDLRPSQNHTRRIRSSWRNPRKGSTRDTRTERTQPENSPGAWSERNWWPRGPPRRTMGQERGTEEHSRNESRREPAGRFVSCFVLLLWTDRGHANTPARINMEKGRITWQIWQKYMQMIGTWDIFRCTEIKGWSLPEMSIRL